MKIGIGFVVLAVAIAAAGCGSTVIRTTTVTKQITVVDTTTVIQTHTVVKPVPKFRTVTVASVSSSGASSSPSSGYPSELELGGDFAEAMQKAVGSSIQISADATNCSANVTPGSYQCESEDQNGNNVTYNVTASDGRFVGTEDPSLTVGSDSGYPSTVSGSY